MLRSIRRCAAFTSVVVVVSPWQQYYTPVSSFTIPLSTTTTTTTITTRRSSAPSRNYDSTVLYSRAAESSSSSSSSTSTADSDDTIDNNYELPYEKGTTEELMYALGVNLARQLGDVSPLVNDGNEMAQVAKGILDAVVNRLNDEAQRDILGRRGAELNNLIVERADNLRKRIETMGRNMLKEMSETEDAVTLEKSGVVVHRLEAGPEGFGQGVRPTLASSVKAAYHGTLPDGTVFDSTLANGTGEPATFAVQQVVPGWRDGLLTMHEGETAMIGVPPEAGYGTEGTPDGRIPGGATLFIKVQLLEVLSGGIGGGPTLLGADGKKLGGSNGSGTDTGGSGLLGADGNPM